MSEKLQIQITATDGASRVFQQVASGADRMESSLERTRASAQRLSAAGFALGAALGIGVQLLGESARAAAEAQVSQDRLQASIEATGSLYDEYADRIKAAGDAAVQMAFDDEDAADAISFLTQATGDASTAINDLGLVMDIARGRGISLADAAKIVAAAEQERFGALRRIGIQLDENATKEEAIAALQQKYAGQAQAYAESEAGWYDRLVVKLGNVNESLGEHTGQLQQVLMLLPGLSAGYTAMASALGGLAPLLLSVGKSAGAMVAGSPLLGVAGGVAGGIGLVGWMLAHPEATGISEDIDYFKAFEAQAQKLDLTIARLRSSGNEYAVQVGQDSGKIVSDLTAMSQRQHELLYLIENDQSASIEQTHAWQVELAGINEDIGQKFADNSAYYLTGLAQDINTIVGYTGDGATLMQQKLDDLNSQLKSGWLDPSEYASQVDILANQVGLYDNIAQNTIHSTVALTDATKAASDALYESIGSEETYQDLLRGREIIAKAFAQAQEDLKNQFALTTGEYTKSTDALATGFRVYIQNTDAIAQQSQAVADWAEEMIKARGEYSRLDELVAKKLPSGAQLISGRSGGYDENTDYGMAQRAFERIQGANQNIQDYIDAIQVKAAPALARLTEQQERYLAGLVQATPEQQMLALAYMDSATSAQALQLAQGYLENQDVFGPMIVQAAQANEGLAIILEDLGLIERDREGNITLTGVDTAKSKLDVLTDAIEALVQAEWVAAFGGDVAKAEAAYERATGRLVDWDGKEGTATVNIEDLATGPLYAIMGLVNGLDGRSVTTYVQTVYESVTSDTRFGAMALGGVAGFDNGGMVTIRAGEAGIERLDFPNGRYGLAVRDGLYSVPVGTYVNTAPATAAKLGGGPTIEVHIHGNVYGIDDLEQQLAESFSRTWVRGMRQHEQSLGAY